MGSEAVIISVKAQTRSSRPGIGPRLGDEWPVRVSAAPVENAANRSVIILVAEILGAAPSRVEIVAGARSTHKRLRIAGISQAEAEDRLAKAAG
ncbi:MAG TPA: DUF167 domain-containing protein [Armatimonadota bacterium]|nr:DUF167 domain-containing protein [Armatimonadota bacterium]